MSPYDDPVPLTLLPDDVVLPHRRVLNWLAHRDQWEDALIAQVTKNPFESLLSLLVGSSAAFYLAEREVNPRMRTFWDAFYYITTCASVGYADLFAMTQTGRSIAALVFTFGPALCAQVFDRPGTSQAAILAPNADAVLDKLDAILGELRQMNAG